MSINIHISGETGAEVRAQMADLLAAHTQDLGTLQQVLNAPHVPADTAPLGQTTEPEPVKRGRGRPKAADAAPPAPIQPEPDPEPAEEANLFDDAPAAPPTVEQFLATKEGMRKAMTKYAETYGMPAAQEDGPKMIGAKKMSELPDNSDWAKITTTIAAALESNPYGRQKAA